MFDPSLRFPRGFQLAALMGLASEALVRERISRSQANKKTLRFQVGTFRVVADAQIL